MERSLFIFNFKKFISRLPKGLIFAIIAVICIETAFFSYLPLWKFCDIYYGATGNPAIRYYARLRTSHLYNHKIFLVGDSTTFMNFDEYVLNKHFNDRDVRFFNLGIQNGEISDLVLRFPFINKAKPDGVILPVSMHTFNYKVSARRRLYFIFAKPLFNFFMSPGLSHKKIYYNVFYAMRSMMCGPFMRLKYKRPLSGVLFLTYLKYIFFGKHNISENFVSFFSHSPRPRSYFVQAINDKKNRDKLTYKKNTPFCEKLFVYYIKELLKNDIHPIIIEMPLHPLSRFFYDEADYRHYQDFLYNVKSDIGSDFTFISLKDLPPFEEKDFYSFYYLSDAGREKLMGYLKKRLSSLQF